VEADRPSVLIVDDEPETRNILGILFTHDGFDVVGEATNGLEAVAAAAKAQPNFVILDYSMPQMDGEKAAKVIRTLSPESSIVAFSAVLESQPDWADAFLNKDMIAEIAPLLHQLLEARPAMADEAPSAS
jgi:CheY-like chemotaxis protein